MFNNLINLHDVVVLYQKVSRQGTKKILSRIFRTNEGRIKSAWTHVDAEMNHWWDIPEVQQRWNLLITGNENVEIYSYIREKYLEGKNTLRGLSIGCGGGNKEIRWVASIKDLTLTGIDISEERIQHATVSARSNSLHDRLTFKVGNINTIQLETEVYDLIIFDSALHHFSPISFVLDKVLRALKTTGILVVNEYVGPSRFQWTDEQIRIVNHLLGTIPAPYRKNSNGTIKKRVYRPGRLSMYLSDPSEAAESDRIEPELYKRFTVLEKQEYGGTILQLLFKDIAGNFINDNPETKQLLRHIFNTEDELLKSKKINSDFKLFVLSK